RRPPPRARAQGHPRRGQRRDDVSLARDAAGRDVRGARRAPARARPDRVARHVLRPRRRRVLANRPRADARGVRAGGSNPGGCALTVEETIAALDRGELRVAERVDGDWRVNEEAKQAILDYFRLRELEPQEVGP